MTISEISGVEREHRGNTLVPLGGKLPHYLALRTSLLLDCLQALVPQDCWQAQQTAGKHNRKRLGAFPSQPCPPRCKE